MSCFNDLHTAHVLYNKYCNVEYLGWSASRISMFLSANLLVGISGSKRYPARIREKSFLKLIQFYREVIEIRNGLIDPASTNMNENSKDRFAEMLLTPQELFDAYPRVELLGWTSARIGVFLKCKLLIGVTRGTGRPSLISQASFIRLIEFANSNLDRMKVYI